MCQEGEIERRLNWTGWITTVVGRGGKRVFQNPLFDFLDIKYIYKILLQSIFGVFWITQGAPRPGPMQCFIISPPIYPLYIFQYFTKRRQL